MKSQIWDRRSFLRLCGAVGITAAAVNAGGLERIEAAARSTAGRTPEEIAADEFYWREVQLAYKLDRTLINLNNGFTAPCPRVVL